MALVTDANASPDTALIELNPFVESDLFIIINTYEKALRESETEEGVLLSNYGEIEKNKSSIDSFEQITVQYSEASSEKSTDGSIEVILGKEKASWIPFGECLPCDGRISFTIDNLPHPAALNIFKTFLDSIENFLNMMKDLLDPTNFYADICKLLDALRIVCPQDLIILLALLTWLLSHYITLSFDIDLDWTSILALILLPLLLLLHTLLQLAVNIGLGPVTCLLQLLSVIKQIGSSGKALGLQAKDSFETSLASVKDLGQETVDLVAGNSGTDAGGSTTGKTDINSGLASNTVSAEEEQVIVENPPKGGLLNYQKILGKLAAFELLLIGLQDINLTLQELLKRFTDAIQACMELLNAGLTLRMQLMGAIVQIIRLIGFLKALIKGLTDGSICKDPSQPLSSADVQALIATINGQSSLSGQTNPSPTSISTIGLQLDVATGNLTVSSRITDQSTAVPTCLSSITDDDRAKIQEWIADLESAA